MKLHSKIRYFSMFSGIGGFELGIQRAFDNEYAHIGEKPEQEERSQGRVRTITKQSVLLRPRNRATPLCIGYSEIDKYAIKVYERKFNGHKNYGDATTVNTDKLPDFDLLVGGFPCQSFSIAGKRLGFQDTRGTLFFDIARILANKRPRHLVLENVKGLLSHDNGKTFTTIIGVLTDLGYTVEWQVLNSKDFGVPQNRERVFIVGHLGTECPRQVLPITNAHQPSTKHIPRHTANTLTARYEGAQATGSYIVESELNAQEKVKVGTLRTHKDGEGFREIKSGIAPTIPARAREDGSGQAVIMKSAATRTRAYKGQPETLEIRPDNISNAINSVTKDYYATDGVRIRRLTPKECERLQGFPDNWTEGESDTQRYKMCGNAVTTNVVQAVMERLCV